MQQQTDNIMSCLVHLLLFLAQRSPQLPCLHPLAIGPLFFCKKFMTFSIGIKKTDAVYIIALLAAHTAFEHKDIPLAIQARSQITYGGPDLMSHLVIHQMMTYCMSDREIQACSPS